MCNKCCSLSTKKENLFIWWTKISSIVFLQKGEKYFKKSFFICSNNRELQIKIHSKAIDCVTFPIQVSNDSYSQRHLCSKKMRMNGWFAQFVFSFSAYHIIVKRQCHVKNKQKNSKLNSGRDSMNWFLERKKKCIMS